jgi:mercuric ion binding protein
MKRVIGTVALITSLLATGAAIAAEQTVTLAVSNMTCASCPYIVEKSLTALPGVTKVAVSFEKKSAVVTFDDQKTTVDALIAITTKAGYPATLAAAPAPKIQ